MPMKRWLSVLLIAVALALATKGGVAMAQVAPGGGGGGGGTVTCTTTTTKSFHTTFCSQVPSNGVVTVATSTPSGNAVCTYYVLSTHTTCTTSCPSGTHLSGNTCVSNTTGTGNGSGSGTGGTTSPTGNNPGCTPDGTITIHFLNKCDPAAGCHQGWFDQTNSCGTVTKSQYPGYAPSCNTTADGCACTPNGQTHTGFISCSGTCDYNWQGTYNSCGGLIHKQKTWDPTTCGGAANGCSSSTTCPNGYWDNNGKCQVDCTGGTVTSSNTCACPSGQSDIQGYCCPSGDTVSFGKCVAPTSGGGSGTGSGSGSGGGGTPPPSCTAPQNGPVSSSGPYTTGCASQGEYSTVTDHSQVVWSCPGPTATTNTWKTYGTEPTSDCQPVIKIDGTKPLACAAAPDTGSAWSSYTYQHCLSYLGNKVNCGPTLTYTPTKPYQVLSGTFPEPVYNPVACPVPIAVGT